MEGGGVRRKACARCREQKKGCEQDCKFFPYFPAHEPEKYAKLHEVFGADNFINKLKKLPVDQQEVALTCMVYKAEARLQYPVYGCLHVIRALRGELQAVKNQNSFLTEEVHRLQQLILLGDMLAAKVQMLQRPGTALLGEVGEVQMLQSQQTAPVGEVQMLHSQLNYRNDEVEQLNVMPEAAPSNRNPSRASPSNSGLPR